MSFDLRKSFELGVWGALDHHRNEWSLAVSYWPTAGLSISIGTYSLSFGFGNDKAGGFYGPGISRIKSGGAWYTAVYLADGLWLDLA